MDRGELVERRRDDRHRAGAARAAGRAARVRARRVSADGGAGARRSTRMMVGRDPLIVRRHRGAGGRAGAAAGVADDLRGLRHERRRSRRRRSAAALRPLRRTAGAARRRQRGGRARAAEGVSAADASRSSSTTASRPTFRSINGAQARRSRGRGSGGGDRGGRQRRSRRRGGSAVIVCRSAAELERMREAGRLVGEVLTELTAQVAPGVTTADLDALAEKRIRAGRGDAGVQGLSRVSGDDLRVDQRRSDSRDSLGPPRAERGRHHLDRRRRVARRVLRRQRGHAAGRPGVGGGGDAAAGHRGVALQGDRAGAAGRPGLGHRPRGAAARRGVRDPIERPMDHLHHAGAQRVQLAVELEHGHTVADVDERRIT